MPREVGAVSSEPVVVLAIIDALLVGVFFLFRVLPWSRPGPWRLIWLLATVTSAAFMLGELIAVVTGGSALWFEHQAPLFLAILAATACFMLAYLHGQRTTERALTLALTDDLTGLLNGRAFAARTDVILRRKEPLSLIYVDLDGVKEVNDQLGHDRGDVLLKKFADVLRANIAEGDIAARLGGDEFAVLLLDANTARARSVGERLLAGLHEIGGRDLGVLWVGASMGIATRVDGGSVTQLLKAADRAMYRAKRAGGNRIATASDILS